MSEPVVAPAELRKKSAGWTPILIYLFPAMMDMVLAQILFVNPVRAARMTDDPRLVTGLLAVWGGVYMIASPIVGRFLTARNSSTLLLLSCAGTILLSVLFPLMPSLLSMYLLVALFGIVIALFFPPFQVFMKAVDAGSQRSLSYSTGMYTFSWSIGFAAAPLLSGYLMDRVENGWMDCYLISGLISLFCAIGILLLRHHAGHGGKSMESATGVEPDRGETKPGAGKNSAIDYSRMPDLAWLAWIAAGGGLVAVNVIRSLFPSEAENVYHLSSTVLGRILFVISFVQALTGLALCSSRLWMYSSLRVVLTGLPGLGGLLCFTLGTTVPVFMLGALLFGLFTGCFYFYFVFHAIAHPVKAGRYVAINEAVVGITSIAGPLLAGEVARSFSYSSAYGLAALLLALVLIFQVCIHRRYAVAANAG